MTQVKGEIKILTGEHSRKSRILSLTGLPSCSPFAKPVADSSDDPADYGADRCKRAVRVVSQQAGLAGAGTRVQTPSRAKTATRSHQYHFVSIPCGVSATS